jgi:D-amino-acid dehydrogenase
MSRITILGGGIIGLFTAYFAQREGFEVHIVDQSDLSNNCSSGNAGMIVPSHIIPLASPGVVAKGLRWLTSKKSPFYIHPRWDAKLLQWCLLFYRHANKRHVEKSIPYLKQLSLLSRLAYTSFIQEHSGEDLGFQPGGLLMLSRSAESHHEEVEAAMLAREHGMEVEIVDKQGLQQFEAMQALHAYGGVFYPEDAHLDSGKLYTYLWNYLKTKGVTFHLNANLKDFHFEGSRLHKVILEDKELVTDSLIVAAGAWSGVLSDRLQLKLPMMGGKGYTFWQENHPPIQQASILVEARVSVSPYGEKVRFGGTMEIAGTDSRIDPYRLMGIFESIKDYYPEFKAETPKLEEVWSGLRPCSPDGMPYIGKTDKWDNIYLATGHSMMGLSLAPATGMLITDLLLNKEPSIPIEAFHPDRFFSGKTSSRR